jgi:iron complex outermembrane recepter protein
MINQILFTQFPATFFLAKLFGKRSLTHLLFLIIFCCMIFGAAQGNPPTGTIEGIVTDQAGAAISSARLILRGATDRETYSDEQGRYVFSALRSGDYTLIVEKVGFKHDPQKLTIGEQAQTLNLTLLPAVVTETVTITSNDGAAENLTKLPGSLHETPRAISIISADQMRERNFRTITDALNFIPGMSVNSYRTGAYHFYARGYRMGAEDTRIDGFIGLNVSGGYGASLFGIEQAVALRGPAGLLYGATSSPGGMINLITKKPQELRSTRLDLRSGGYAGNGVGLTERPSISFDLDSTGALDNNGRILYRALFTLENQNYFTNHVLDRNRYANGSLTFKLDPLGRYTLTPIGQYARFNRPAGGGIVISPTTSLSANDGISGPINEKDLSPLDVNTSAGGRVDETAQAGFDFRAVPTNAWRTNFSYRFLRLDTFINQFLPQVSSAAQINLLKTQNQVQRVLSKSDTFRQYHNFDANTSYELRGASWKNLTQVGGYTRVTSVRSTTPIGATPAAHSPINIYTGVAASPLIDNHPALTLGSWSDTTMWNGYLQNRTSVLRDKMIFTLGVGYGQSHPGGRPVQKGEWMPNAALVFNLTKQLALYGSYTTSFNPTDPTLENVAGVRGAFAPTGENYEFGAKYDLLSRRASATLSFFKNEVSNALVQTGITDVNRNGNRYYIEAGTRRSRGVELSSDFQVRANWFVSGAISYVDAIYTGEGPASAASTLAIPGSRAEKTPRWSWHATTRYERSEGKLAGLGGSLSFLWQDERLGSNGARTLSAPDPLLLPAFARVDAAVSYRLNEHWDWALNFENLLDKKIFVNASVGSAIEIAPPRTATLRIGYRF